MNTPTDPQAFEAEMYERAKHHQGMHGDSQFVKGAKAALTSKVVRAMAEALSEACYGRGSEHIEMSSHWTDALKAYRESVKEGG